MPMLKTVHAIYKKGRLIFANEQMAPKDGTQVIVTFSEGSEENISEEMNAIKALRGRGKGEKLVEKLLKERREDFEHEARNYRNLRS